MSLVKNLARGWFSKDHVKKKLKDGAKNIEVTAFTFMFYYGTEAYSNGVPETCPFFSVLMYFCCILCKILSLGFQHPPPHLFQNSCIRSMRYKN